MIEAVVNVSAGRDPNVIGELSAECEHVLLDVHRDAVHDRSVFTLAGSDRDVQQACQSLTRAALELININLHRGPHPRLGAVDVVPFVPLGSSLISSAVAERDLFADWAGTELSLPCFLYGPLPDATVRNLPDVRRLAFNGLRPDTGPDIPHRSAGACTVGARGYLVAYNISLTRPDLETARAVASKLRGPNVRSLAFDMGHVVQISFNLIDPLTTGPDDVYDATARALATRPDGNEIGIESTELVGLVPAALLERVPRHRWEELDLCAERTIEARMQEHRVSTAKDST